MAAHLGRPKDATSGGMHAYEQGESYQQTVAVLKAEFDALSPKQREEKLADVRRALQSASRTHSPLVRLAKDVYGL